MSPRPPDVIPPSSPLYHTIHVPEGPPEHVPFPFSPFGFITSFTTMANPTRQTFIARNGNKYSFTHVKPTSRDNTLLFLHGFPSTLYDWIFQIRYFTTKGYGVVALDLLGYGETSAPDDVGNYRLKSMSDEVVQLLDSLQLQQVIGVGHDFGATLLSRLAAYHPQRWSTLVFLSVGPPSLGTPFDVDAINLMTKGILGFEMLGYIPFIAEDTAPAILEKHAESAMTLMFCRDAKEWDTWFHPLNKMKEFITHDRKLPIGPWYIPDLQQHHIKAFSSSGGYEGASKWYRMWKNNLSAADEVGYEGFKISQRALLIVPKESNQQREMLEAWVPQLKTVEVEAGHWVHLEREGETNAAILKFLEDNVVGL